ncbi:hypothetical protein KHQ81_07185 [Mycoplasmatota bacterium]|nr:hypothetical protein KHQ81_07185 [Mycoplasmatota bacterium]
MSEYDLSNIFRKKFISKGLKSLLKQVKKNDLEISLAIMLGDEFQGTKDEIIDLFSVHHGLILDNALKSFQTELFDFIYKIIDHGGEIEFKNIDPGYAILLKIYLIAFPVIKDNKNKLVMSNEVMDYFLRIDIKHWRKEIQLNDLVIHYARGLLNYYGAYEANMIFKYIKEYESIDLNMEEFYVLLNNDSLIYGYDIKDEVIYYYQINEITHFYDNRNKYKELDYYHLTKDQILNPDEITDFDQEIIDFYEHQLEMPEAMAQHGLYLLKDSILFEVPLPEIKGMLKQLHINGYQLKQLEKLVEKLSLNTRLWSLKGHTKNEISIPKMIRFPKR